MPSKSKRSDPRRIDFDDALISDKAGNEVSPVPPAATTPRKRTLHSFLSPVKTINKDAAFVTPLKKSRIDEESEEKKGQYIPTHLYKNIEYKRQGEADLNEITKKAFELVQEHFLLPKDLETNRKYGPKSGICFEEHAIRAYSQNMLQSKSGSISAIEICTACATTGHKRNDCPSLV
jgi:hypothetical protein